MFKKTISSILLLTAIIGLGVTEAEAGQLPPPVLSTLQANPSGTRNAVGINTNQNPTFGGWTSRAPSAADDTAHGHTATDLWLHPGDRSVYLMADGTANNATWAKQFVPTTFGNATSVAPTAVYGVCRQVASYSGNLFTLTRTSDSTTLAVPISASGCADPTPIDGFCANTRCWLSTLNDQTANSFNCTQATAANGAEWLPGHWVNGVRAISFNGVLNTTGSLSAVAKYCSAAGIPAWNTNNYSWVFTGKWWGGSNISTFVMDATNTYGDGTYNNAGTLCSSCQSGVGTGIVTGAPVPSNAMVWVTTHTTSGITAYLNNDIATASGNANHAVSGLILGGSGGASSGKSRFDMTGFAFYTTAINAADQLAVRASAAQSGQIAVQCCDVAVVLHGDSTPMGNGAVTQYPAFNRAMDALNRQVKYYNLAVAGERITGGALTSIAYNAQVDVARIWNAGLYKYVSVIEGGPNDIRASVSAASIASALQTSIPVIKAYANAYIVLASSLVQTDILANGTQLAVLQTLNNNVINNFNTLITNGGLGADYLVNIWSNPLVGPGNYTTSALASGTCSPDGQHLTELCQGYYAAPYAYSLQTAIQ